MMVDQSRVDQPLVYVVTLAWNRRDDTMDCLGSLSQMTYSRYLLLLVDNASTDGTAEAVEGHFPEVEVVVNEENLGFAGGFNVGLRYAMERDADYVLIINNDTSVEPDMLEQLMGHADLPDVGLLAPKIFYADQPDRIWSVGARRHPWTWEMTDVGSGQRDVGQWDEVLDRDYLVGCALLMKRTLLEEVGLFDEGFRPAYYEDLDLCLRARQTGYRLLMVPQARMLHKGAASSEGEDSPLSRYCRARNSVRFFRKHVRGPRWLIVAPFRFGSAVKTCLRLAAERRWASLRSHLRGLLDGLALVDEDVRCS